MTAPLRVLWGGYVGRNWWWSCRICLLVGAHDSYNLALKSALDHLREHTPTLRDATGWVALLGPAAVWCPLCYQRIANGLAEDEARHIAAEHWEWHTSEMGRAS